MPLELGFDFSALGAIVNGCDDFAFGNVRNMDEFFGVSVHQSITPWTAHFSYSNEMFSRP